MASSDDRVRFKFVEGACTCGHYASQHGLGWKGCAYCNCPQYKEPPHGEGA